MSATSPSPSPSSLAAPPAAAWLLALDASTPRTVVAVGWVEAGARAQALVVGDDADDGDQASATLTGRMAAALGRAGIEARALAAVACGRGPGTFTGTRVAVATAKGLAYGLGRPVVPVSTLAAVAASLGPRQSGSVLAVVDARRGEVYGGRFRCEIEREGALPRVDAEGEERVATLAAWLESISPWPAGLRVVGSGVGAQRESVPPELAAGAVPLPGPTAEGLWAASVAAFVAGPLCHPAALEAVYLRASYAELGVNVPKRPFVKSPFV